MSISKLLAVVATILFGVAFVLVAFTSGNRDIVEDLLYLGLACFAGAHAL